MSELPPFVDIHCHLVPGIDDGAKSWDESLAMARMAAADGVRTIVVTPHQLGSFAHNRGDAIRQRTAQLQAFLDEHAVPLTVLPGADVRIEDNMAALLRSGEVLSLADRRRHVLLELPHELYFPLEPVLAELERHEMIGILSHPERNHGLLKDRRTTAALVDHGCLMQVTCGSLLGAFGPVCQEYATWMLEQGLVHFLATDAHGPKSRRPLMARAFERTAELVDEETALNLCCHFPAQVAAGRDTPRGVQRTAPRSSGLARWFGWRKAG